MSTRLQSHTNGTGQVQMGDNGPSALQFGHVALRFPCVWSTEQTPEREALQLDDVLKDSVKDWVWSQPQEFWEQGSYGLLISGGLWCIF
ncbi:hypothetical protein TNCV_1863901 [Trichonephila clavipes]|nr:hypothetical protein TNCV_1863901 [Trichonephila clavipes]